MALPGSGTLSFSQVNSELGRAASQGIDLNDGAVRALAGAPSGAISFSQLRGKSSYTPMSIQPQNVYDERQIQAGGSNYTGSWQAAVSVQGGAGGYSYAWSFNGASNGFTLSTNNSYTATVTHTVSRFGTTAACDLNCVVTDGIGRQVSTVVNVYFNYYTNQ